MCDTCAFWIIFFDTKSPWGSGFILFFIQTGLEVVPTLPAGIEVYIVSDKPVSLEITLNLYC